MFKTKILIVGPPECGKTVISNFLAEATDRLTGDYAPTQGVRILEFEVGDVKVANRDVRAEVELWDCSGDRKFESCWPALSSGAGGIVFVCNPDREKEHNKELQTWYSYYVDQQQSLKPDQCVVFCHSKSGESSSRRPNLYMFSSGDLGRLELVQTSLENDGEDLKSEFSRYLGSVLSIIKERREQEELGIINSR